MNEAAYQAKLIKKLKELFPGCVVLKNDSGYLQGVPDLSVFYGRNWAALEVKASAKAPTQPNQEYYVEEMNAMAFAAFIYPENEEEVLDAMEEAFASRGATRVS